MGLSESAAKLFGLLSHCKVTCHVILLVVLRFVDKITVVMLILIHMNMLTAVAKKSI